jgi:hypothetical protein
MDHAMKHEIFPSPKIGVSERPKAKPNEDPFEIGAAKKHGTRHILDLFPSRVGATLVRS